MQVPDVNRRIPWRTLLLESLLVVLSVLLALALNSWRESRIEHQLAVRAIQSFLDEADNNCSVISSVHEYHKEVAAEARAPEGLRVGMLRNNAWQSAQSTGAASYVEYGVAEIVGQVDALQQHHRTIMQSYVDALFIRLGSGTSLEAVHGDLDVAAIRELTRIQEELLELYAASREKALAVYDEIEHDGSCRHNPSKADST